MLSIHHKSYNIVSWHPWEFLQQQGAKKEHPNYVAERARIHGHKADERSSAKVFHRAPAADTDELYLDTRVTSTSHAGEQDTAAATVARWRRWRRQRRRRR